MKKFFIAVLLFSMFMGSVYGDKIYRLPTTIVSADRFKSSKNKTSYRVTVITAKEIENLALRNLSEIIDYSSNIITSDNGYNGSVAKISMRGGFTRHITVMIDGVPINSSFNGSPDLTLIPTESIKRIEIIEGPISAMYGSGSISGVINIITKDDSRNTFSIGLKNRNGYKCSASVSTPFGYLLFSIGNDRSWRSNTDLSKNSFLWEKKISINRFDLSLTTLYSGYRVGVPGPMPDSNFIPEFGDSTANSLYNYQNTHKFLTRLSSIYNFNSNNMIRLNYSLSFDSLLYYSQYRSFIDNSVQHSYYEYLTISNFPEIVYLLSKHSFDFSIGGNLNVQNNYSHSDVYGDSNILSDSSSWNVKYNTYSIFQEGKLKFIPHFILENKLRYDYVVLSKDTISRKFNALSYALGTVFNYKIFLLKANYGTAFKNPGLNDLFFPYMGNPDLKAENSREFSTSFGINLYKTDFNVSYFNKSIDNLIYWNGMTPQNINSVKINGLESGFKASFSLLSLSINLLYQKSISHDLIDSLGNYIERPTPYSPDFKASYGITLYLPLGFTLGNSGTFTSSYVNYFKNYSGGIDTVKTENNFIINANVNKNMDNTNISFSINNILDYRGIKNFGYSAYDRGYPFDGRRFEFSISSTF